MSDYQSRPQGSRRNNDLGSNFWLYLRTRPTESWVFFAIGIFLGGLFF